MWTIIICSNLPRPFPLHLLVNTKYPLKLHLRWLLVKSDVHVTTLTVLSLQVNQNLPGDN